jgi:hypothetical protein
LHPSALTITASGNVQAIETGMGEFGEVKVFDDEGAIVDTPVFI